MIINNLFYCVALYPISTHDRTGKGVENNIICILISIYKSKSLLGSSLNKFSILTVISNLPTKYISICIFSENHYEMCSQKCFRSCSVFDLNK